MSTCLQPQATSETAKTSSTRTFMTTTIPRRAHLEDPLRRDQGPALLVPQIDQRPAGAHPQGDHPLLRGLQGPRREGSGCRGLERRVAGDPVDRGVPNGSLVGEGWPDDVLPLSTCLGSRLIATMISSRRSVRQNESTTSADAQLSQLNGVTPGFSGEPRSGPYAATGC